MPARQFFGRVHQFLEIPHRRPACLAVEQNQRVVFRKTNDPVLGGLYYPAIRLGSI